MGVVHHSLVHHTFNDNALDSGVPFEACHSGKYVDSLLDSRVSPNVLHHIVAYGPWLTVYLASLDDVKSRDNPHDAG